MENWQTRYAQKLAAPTDAIRLVPPGRRILIGSGAAEPAALVEALAKDGEHLADNEIVHLLTLGPAPYVAPELAARASGTRRSSSARTCARPCKRGAPTSCRFSSPRSRADSLAAHAHRRRAHPGEPARPHGYVSLGVSVDIVRAAVDAADLVIAEVNPRMPRTLGDSFLHVDRIARLVPVDVAAARARCRAARRRVAARSAGTSPRSSPTAPRCRPASDDPARRAGGAPEPPRPRRAHRDVCRRRASTWSRRASSPAAERRCSRARS